jgi:catechol 2,3-dioxygenase-like lactoylglutathione lyase family enzyme
MFSHVMVGSDDIARSKKFYDALFGAVGGKAGVQDAKGRLIYAHNGGLLMVSKPINGEPACHANGGTIGFAMNGPEQAEAWHKAGVANGGTAIEDPPGVRKGGSIDMYLAYIRDPDGNKLCALHRMAAP